MLTPRHKKRYFGFGEYSPIEHLAKIAALSRFSWQEVHFAMFTACFDAAGSEHDQRFFVVAGFISTADEWIKFDKAWKDRLAQDGLSYFHAVDFAASREEFKHGWKENEPRRRKLTEDLIEIIRLRAFRFFGNVVEVKTLQKHLPAEKLKEYHLNAYALCAMTCVKDVLAWCKQERSPQFERIRFVFEDGDLGRGNLIRRFKDDLEMTPNFEVKRDTETKYGKRFAFVPLQASDFLAYELFQGSKNMSDRKHQPRWPLQEFLSMPGYPNIIEADNLERLDLNHRVAKETMDRFRKVYNNADKIG